MSPPDTDLRPYEHRGYVAALLFAGGVLFVFGLIFDAVLRGFGIGVAPWFEAFWSALVGVTVSYFVARLFWRMGLVTLPQYLVGAFAIMAPIALLSFLPVIRLFGSTIEMPWLEADVSQHHAIALTVYVRLARAVILVPIYLTAFYWFYHIHLRMRPET